MKTAQIHLGGELRKLDFGRAGLHDHIEEAAKKPAFEFMKSLTPEKDAEGNSIDRSYTITEISVLIYAGINSANDVDGLPLVDFETVKRWVRCIDIDKLAEVFISVVNAMAGNQGEGNSQPEQGSN